MPTEHTVVVLCDEEGSILGGYADVAWDMSNKFKPSSDAFLFCLASTKAPHAAPCALRLRGESHYGYAVNCRENTGPCFGERQDLVVYDDGHVHCDLGGSYEGGAFGVAVSRHNRLPVAAMEVWQLSSAA